jgi:hypothetical protein
LIEEAAPPTGAASFIFSAAIRAAAETAPRRGCSLRAPLARRFRRPKSSVENLKNFSERLRPLAWRGRRDLTDWGYAAFREGQTR